MTQPPAWVALLRAADNTSLVVALANEYLNRLDRHEIDALSSECKPRALLSAADVNGYAVDLMRCDGRGAEGAKIVRNVSAFFQEAAQRLAQLNSLNRAGTSAGSQQKSEKA